ncbi:hypothetical protein [Pedobacter sp. NJ-S-72]
MEKNLLKGALLVGLGASSYGALATVVKMAYEHGFNTAEVTTSQFTIGFTGMLLLNILIKNKSKAKEEAQQEKGAIWKLMLGGTSLGTDQCVLLFCSKVYSGISRNSTVNAICLDGFITGSCVR